MSTIDCPKCEHEHEPVGNHEEDAGEMTCDQCGFRFIVEIEYDPSYSTRCVKHKFGGEEIADCHSNITKYRRCVFCNAVKLT